MKEKRFFILFIIAFIVTNWTDILVFDKFSVQDIYVKNQDLLLINVENLNKGIPAYSLHGQY